MILTFTPNPAVDVTITTPRLERGRSTVVATARSRAGGKGVNVSRVLVERGEPTHALIPVGHDDAAWFAHDLAGVPHELVLCEQPTRRSYAIVEADPDAASLLNEAGTARLDDEWDRSLDRLRRRAAAAEVLVSAGSLPPDAPATVMSAIARIARDAGIPSVLDVAGSRLLEAATAGADVLKPNRDELTDALGPVEPTSGARALQDRGAGLVVVSLGADGMVVVPVHGPAVHARLARAVGGNPTGAGDAAVAALSSLLRGRDPRALAHDEVEALGRRAVTWSAAAVHSPQAGSLGLDPTTLEADVRIDTLDR